MSKPKYELIIYWSEEDQAFVAEETSAHTAEGAVYAPPASMYAPPGEEFTLSEMKRILLPRLRDQDDRRMGAE